MRSVPATVNPLRTASTLGKSAGRAAYVAYLKMIQRALSPSAKGRHVTPLRSLQK